MFEEFQKIARLSRNCTITEKIDGTNGQVHILTRPEAEGVDPSYIIAADPDMDLVMLAGSRTRYIIPAADNAGFATWVKANSAELWKLGPGRHYGEWWGAGIQRRYGLGKTGEKRFSLFNTARWGETPDTLCAPACCHVVPVLARGIFTMELVDEALNQLREYGSAAAPGFMDPEGIVIYQTAARQLFKKTLKGDESPKGLEIPNVN